MNNILENIILLIVIAGFLLALGILLWLIRVNTASNKAKLQENDLEKIELVLNPLKDQIHNLNKQIVELQKEQAAAKESFRNNVSQVIEQTSKIRIDAENLCSTERGFKNSRGLGRNDLGKNP